MNETSPQDLGDQVVASKADASHRLVVEHVAKSFVTPAETLQVLHDVCLSLVGGQSLAVIGPSGSGKTTLLQIMGALDQPDSGTVKIDDQDPFLLSESARAWFRNEMIGFVFQDHHLLPQLSVIENVLIPAVARGSATKEQVERADDLVEAVGLADRRSHLSTELSGGQRERVAIARALLMNPALLLADEPTGNLDSKTAAKVSELLLELQQREGTILIAVTHSNQLAATMNETRVLVDGRLRTPD
ncbi:MAG: ABC transporter ATP-binding protein [Planctomycetota bacterium]